MNKEQTKTQIANSTGVVPDPTLLLMKAASSGESKVSVPVLSQSNNDCYETLDAHSAITALVELCVGSTSRPSGPASVLSTDQKADNIVDDGSFSWVVSWIIATKGVIKHLNRP